MQSDIIDINVRTDCTFFCLFVVLGRPTGLPHIRLWTSNYIRIYPRARRGLLCYGSAGSFLKVLPHHLIRFSPSYQILPGRTEN